VQRRLAIAECDEQLIRQWTYQFPSDVIYEEEFFAVQREQRRRDRRHRRVFAEREVENPNTTLCENDPRWNNV
jgi:hypothetical protein